MASHQDDSARTADLIAMLDTLPLEFVQGLDSHKSQHGVAYRSVRLIGSDPEALMNWYRSVLMDVHAAGGTTIVQREPPRMTRYEERRQFSFGLVARIHAWPPKAHEALCAIVRDTEGGPAIKI
jgi:hypothetical protein